MLLHIVDKDASVVYMKTACDLTRVEYVQIIYRIQFSFFVIIIISPKYKFQRERVGYFSQ